MKSNKVIPLIISFLFFTAAITFIVPVKATVTDTGVYKGLKWEYGEKTISSVCFLEFEDERMTFASEGEHNSVYNHSYSYISGDYLYEYITETNTSQVYSSNSTQEITGNFTISMDLLCDYVSVRDGGHMSYEWIGAKRGIWSAEQWMVDMTYFSENNNTCNNSYREWEYMKNATTGEIISTDYSEWNSSYSYNSTFNSSDFGDMYANITGMKQTVEFIIPLQLSTTVFTATNWARLLWSNLFCEAILYNDTNNNGIYDMGSSSTMNGLPTMMFSDEYYGMLLPYAVNMTELEQTSINKTTGASTTMDMIAMYAGMGIPMEYPVGVDFDAIQNNISFNFVEPFTNGDGQIEFSWAQDVNTIPTMIQLGNPIIDPMNYVATMEDMDTQYTYGMKLLVNKSGILKTEANNSFGHVANSTIKAMLPNISIAVPYQSAFLASTKVNNSKTIGVPQKATDWLFKLGNLIIGELELDNPFKENYTLLDYPLAGNETVYQSIGSSVSKIILDVGENPNPQTLMGAGSNPFASIMYTLGDLYDLPSNYKMSLSYELVNYPTWEGNRIVHDPVFTVHVAPLVDWTAAGGGTPPIPGFEIFLVLVALPIVILFYIRRKQSEKVNLL